ncbi:DNA polymerase beta-like protein [Dinothrombium tinctorium]|uniref:DNA polymerase n=1 Tax=Dinothrombium tinctorium TaxID=1965070 RepID=A0A3S3PDG0_9ACAR|nr:DNA polymerase beta-like protein [Dinothrombium tinctorium]
MDSKRKPKSHPNEDICDMLNELANYENNVKRDVHRSRAYRKAAKTLSDLNYRVKSGEDAIKLPGIGKSIAAKIEEYLNTGEMKKLNAARKDDHFAIINDLTRVSGIGPVFAKELMESGITSIEELKKNIHLLNHHQKIGLKYLNDFEQKIPRSEMEQMEKFIKKVAKEIEKNIIITICGSYRRGLPESGDIDVLITDENSHNYLNLLVEKLTNKGFITDTIAQGDTKFMGVCKLQNFEKHRRIDIRFIPFNDYYCGVLYFTGSQMFNQEMRRHALEQGYTLNEHSLRKLGSTGVPGEPLVVASERDIFEYISFPYKEPSERNW